MSEETKKQIQKLLNPREKLKRFLERAKADQRTMSIEWDSCRDVYQAIGRMDRAMGDYALDSAQISELVLRDSYDLGEEGEELDLPSLKAVQATLFLQSKLAISDPTVTVDALTQAQDDKRAAEYAGHFVRYFRRHTDLDEEMEKSLYLNTACLGTGVIYLGWKKDEGELDENGVPKGDFCVKGVHPSDLFIDPEIHNFKDQWRVVYRRLIPIEEALSSFPDASSTILSYVQKRKEDEESKDLKEKDDPDKITIFEYWEKGTVWNGFKGSLFYFVDFDEPKLLSEPAPNPYDHKRLPFHVLTDVDISESAWGMSRLVLASTSFDTLSNIYTLVLSNAMLHGQIRLLYPTGEVPDEILNDNTVKAIPYSPYSGAKAEHLKPTTVSGDFWALKNSIDADIDSLYGMNEFSRGQVGRELSSYTVQMAIEMDDKFRVRLFNKKKRLIQCLYRDAIELAKQYVGDERSLEIAGPEQSDEFISFKGSNLKGNYTLTVDYGMFLPADPAARKNQIIELIKLGVFKETGLDMKKILTMLIDGDMLDVKDYLEGARKVQDAENQKMTLGLEVAVQPYHEHKGHLESLTEIMNTQEFESYAPEVKKLFIDHKQKHVEALAKLEANAAKAGAPKGGQPAPQQPLQ